MTQMTDDFDSDDFEDFDLDDFDDFNFDDLDDFDNFDFDDLDDFNDFDFDDLTLRQSLGTLQFSTSVEVRVLGLGMLGTMSVCLSDSYPENRAKDFLDFLHECSLLYN